MTPMQTVLNNLSAFGTQLEAFCRDLRDRTQDDFVRLIVHQIAVAQRRISQTKESLAAVDPAEFNVGALSNADVELLIERVFADSYVPSQSGKDDLIETVVERLDVMNAYYEWLLAQPIAKATTAFIGTVLSEQKAQIERLGRLKSSV